MKHYQKMIVITTVFLLNGCAVWLVGYQLNAVSQGVWTSNSTEVGIPIYEKKVTTPCNGRILKLELVGNTRAAKWGIIIPTDSTQDSKDETGFFTRLYYEDGKPMGVCPIMRINGVDKIKPRQDYRVTNACQYSTLYLRGRDRKVMDWDKSATLDIEFLDKQDGCMLDNLKVEKLPYSKYVFVGLPRT